MFLPLTMCSWYYAAFALLLTAGFAILSMGPYLRIMGNQTAVRLPICFCTRFSPRFGLPGFRCGSMSWCGYVLVLRQRLEYLRSTPVLSTLLSNNQVPGESVTPEMARDILTGLNVRCIITHDDLHRAFLEDHLGFPLEHTSPELTVYRVGVPHS